MVQSLQRKMKNSQGFTLIELIVVIAIIAILAAVLIPRFTGFTESAKKKTAVSNARNILIAVEAMYADGDTDILASEINAYTGKTYIAIKIEPGYILFGASLDTLVTNTAAAGLGGATYDTFKYVYYDGAKYYALTVSDGEIPTDAVVTVTTTAP